MTNAEWIINTGRKFEKLESYVERNDEERTVSVYYGKDLLGKLYVDTNITAESGLHKWLDLEHEELKPLLTQKEHDYLTAVIAPFRDRVDRINKSLLLDGVEWINIETTNPYDTNFHWETCDLPCFKEGEHFSGLNRGHDYTLEELDL